MRYIVVVFVVVSFMGLAQADMQRDDYMRMYVVSDRYENVRDDLELAITERGIKINNISYIGNMLARTGKDLGAKKRIFSHAEAFEFCSARASRATMEADPHNIVFCPYIIAVYSLPNEENKTYISFRRPTQVGSKASKVALQKVEDLMIRIVEEVAK